MTEVICTECNELIKLTKLKRNVLDNVVYEYYFNCSNCNLKYVSYYTNQKIRRDIKRQQKRWAKYRVAGTEATERKLLAEINMNDKLIKKDMDNLKDKIKALK